MTTIKAGHTSNAYSLIISGALITFGTLPLTLWFYLWTFALRARLYLGYWPSYSQPDPKDLPLHFHPPTELLHHIIPLGLSIGIILALTSLLRKQSDLKIRMMTASILALTGWIVAFGLIFIDPCGFMEWWAD